MSTAGSIDWVHSSASQVMRKMWAVTSMEKEIMIETETETESDTNLLLIITASGLGLILLVFLEGGSPARKGHESQLFT